MSEIGDVWKEIRERQRERRAERLPRRTDLILQLQEDGFKIKELTPYQFRVNDVLDIYPTHHRFHDLRRNRRGGFKHLQEFVKGYFR